LYVKNVNLLLVLRRLTAAVFFNENYREFARQFFFMLVLRRLTAAVFLTKITVNLLVNFRQFFF